MSRVRDSGAIRKDFQAWILRGGDGVWQDGTPKHFFDGVVVGERSCYRTRLHRQSHGVCVVVLRGMGKGRRGGDGREGEGKEIIGRGKE